VMTPAEVCALAEQNQAPNQCPECHVYRIDGSKPILHHRSCVSSGTAGHTAHCLDPEHVPDDPRWVELLMRGFNR
jgi:hypothetical protein